MTWGQTSASLHTHGRLERSPCIEAPAANTFSVKRPRRHKPKAILWASCTLLRKGGFIQVSSLTHWQFGSRGPTAATLQEAWATLGSVPRREPRTTPRADLDGNRILPSGPKVRSKSIANGRGPLLAARKEQVKFSPRFLPDPLFFPFSHISSAGKFSRTGSCTPPLSPAANFPASSVGNDDGVRQGAMIPGAGVSPLRCKRPSPKALFSTLTPFSEAGSLAARGVTPWERTPARFRRMKEVCLGRRD